MLGAPDEPTTPPRVSVVLPTHGRPALVTRAVASALAQTLRDSEVIVVVDGADLVTEAALAAVTDPRLRVEVLPEHRGVSVARYRGAELARAPRVAFLDDDDEWFPPKLERQLQRAEDPTQPCDIVATRILAPYGQREYLWPRRLPRPGESAAEYMLSRSSIFFGETMLLTTTLLIRRELILRQGFSVGMERGQHMDWLVRVTAGSGARVGFVPEPEPLAVWYQAPVTAARRAREAGPDWRYLLAWLDGLRPLLSRRAYSSALLTWLANGAAELGETDAFWPFLRAAFRHGQPTRRDVLLYLAVWVSPRQAGAAVSSFYDRLLRRIAG